MKAPLFLVPLLAGATLLSSAFAASPPTGLKATPQPNPLGLDLNEFSFSWVAESEDSFQVLVASDEKLLEVGAGDRWDSGRRFFVPGETRLRYVGSPIEDGETVWWKVRSWDAEGEAGQWSAPARIEVPANDQESLRVRRSTGSDGGAPKFEAGAYGRAMRFGAEHPRVWGLDYRELRPTEGTTIAAWVKPQKVTGGWQCIFRKDDGDQRRLLAIGKEGPFWGLWCGFNIGGKYVEFGAPYDSSKLADGEWHHLAVTFDGKHLRLFVDGAKIGEKAQAGALGAGGGARAYLGSHGGDAEQFEGLLDDVRIYDRGLKEGEIGALGGSKPDALNVGLVAHWRFDGSIENEATSIVERTRNRIVLLGGTLIADMDRHGYLETMITAHWPHHEITFRNLGWPADDVFGTARSEFGSAHNTRSWQPPKGKGGFGFEKLTKQLAEAQPTTIIVGYGAEAAWADTEEKMERFKEGYRALVRSLEESGAKLILLAPLDQRVHRGVLPDASERNVRIEEARSFIMREFDDHVCIDLTERLGIAEVFLDREALAKDPSYRNGVHLTESGHRRLAVMLAGSFASVGTGVGIRFGDGGQGVVGRGGRMEAVEPFKRGVRFDLIADRLDLAWPGAEGQERAQERLRIDGGEVRLSPRQPKFGVGVSSGPDHEQAEQLRQAIVEKNQLSRFKLNPINKAYIFLFRRHEMGHLAYEMEDFEALVTGREQAIAKLRVPRAHRYELELADEWKAPRDYPDHEVPKDIPAPDIAAELKAFKVADGFKVNLFASDPMIFNPINLNWDSRGRAWVATSSTYPHIKPGKAPNDRIVILEDTDHDGVADKSIVFAEGLTVPHSVMPVKGGAYVCSTTELLFLADHDGDDVADEKRVVFSGFGNADVHHMIHGLRWSPWGDLFFTQSIYINSFVETAHGPRRLNGSGIWRFRPETERLDVYARGMVNPWGFAFDRWGRTFATDGAGGSGPHDVFPGSAFGTAVGAPRVLGGLIPGKPKNTAAEVVSGRQMPDHWHGSLLANDFRANRTVRYELEEKGSGFTAKEVETVLASTHRSFRPVDIKMGPDGAVYVVDWYNPIIDHGEVDFHHPSRDKSHGRIWRLVNYEKLLLDSPEIADAKSGEVLELLKSPEQYTRTQANRELVRRDVEPGLIDAFLLTLDPNDPEYDHHRLEVLWLYAARNADPADSLKTLVIASDPRIRTAAVRLAARGPSALTRLAIAVEDEHPRVRLAAVNALREIGTLEAANLALRALDYEVDENLDFALEMTVRDTRDEWLPAMKAGKRVFDGRAGRLAYALRKVNDPRAVSALVPIITGGTLSGEELANAVAMVAALGEAEELRALLDLAVKSPELLVSIAEGGVINANVPPQRDVVIRFLDSKEEAVRIAAAVLTGKWKLAEGIGPLVVRAEKAVTAAERLAMTRALGALGSVDGLQDLWAVGRPPGLRAAAVAAQVEIDPVTASRVAVMVLQELEKPGDGRVVFDAFLGREEGPVLIARAIEGRTIREKVARAGLEAARASGRDVPELVTALGKAGGLKTVAPSLTPEERRLLLEDAENKGAAERGRQVYQRAALACTTCHLVNGAGGKLGPDLSTVGAYMTPESLLESILNPSTAIKQGYETVIVMRKDRSVVSGLLQRRTDTAALVRDPTGAIISIPAGEIEKLDTSPVSLMPPGLTSSLHRDDLVDLMAYLTSLGRAK